MRPPRPDWDRCTTKKKAKECGRQGNHTEFGLGYISENGRLENQEIGGNVKFYLLKANCAQGKTDGTDPRPCIMTSSIWLYAVLNQIPFLYPT
jgi:hypothetical protein